MGHEEILKATRERLRMTQSDVAEKAGISLRMYQNIEAGLFPKFKTKSVKAIDSVLGTRVYELIYATNSATAEVGEPVRQPKTAQEPEREGITFIPINAQAGYSRKILDPMFRTSLQKIFIPGMPYRGENYRLWEVEGNSMEPTFKEGFFVLTEKVEGPWKKVKEFHAHVIVTEDDVMLKRLAQSKTKPDHWVLISDNEDLYPPFLLPIAEVKELWFVRRKMDWEMAPAKRFEVDL